MWETETKTGLQGGEEVSFVLVGPLLQGSLIKKMFNWDITYMSYIIRCPFSQVSITTGSTVYTRPSSSHNKVATASRQFIKILGDLAFFLKNTK